MNDRYEQWSANVVQWAYDRNLIEGSTPEKQSIKLCEECVELMAGLINDDIDEIRDAIGDICVVMQITLEQHHSEEQFPCLIDIASQSEMPKSRKRACNAVSSLRLSAAFHELCDDLDELLGAITGFLMYLLHICETRKFQLIDCLEHAWGQIKDRKGKMVNGIFVKEDVL